MYEGNADPTVPQLDLDDRSRLDFMKSFRRFVTSELMPLNRTVYERRVEPRFRSENGRAPDNKTEVRQAMKADPFFRFYASVRRSGHEIMFDNIWDIARRFPSVTESENAQAAGSLRINTDLKTPHYIDAVDIHCMPGGYNPDEGEDGMRAGILYDLGTQVYTMGLIGPRNDALGLISADYIRRKFGHLKPRRILDIGCGTGSCTLAFAKVFPDAEIHGIDVGAPMLRRAHAKARALGLPIHFSQQNGEEMDFEDASFDLVVSHLLFHETSGRAIRNILSECHRLLRPGGVMAHIDMLSYMDMDDFEMFMFDNETYYNNEPFWANFRSLDQIELSAKAGFDREKLEIESVDSALASQVQNTGKRAAKTGFQFLFGER